MSWMLRKSTSETAKETLVLKGELFFTSLHIAEQKLNFFHVFINLRTQLLISFGMNFSGFSANYIADD